MLSPVAFIGSSMWLQLMLVLLVSAAAVSAGAAATAGLQSIAEEDISYAKLQFEHSFCCCSVSR
jgi:hypothetical protein